MQRGAQDPAGALHSCIEGSGREHLTASAQGCTAARSRSWRVPVTMLAAIQSRGEAVCPRLAAGGRRASPYCGAGTGGGVDEAISVSLRRGHPGLLLSQ